MIKKRKPRLNPGGGGGGYSDFVWTGVRGLNTKSLNNKKKLSVDAYIYFSFMWYIQYNGHGPAHNGDNEQDTQNLVYPLGSVLHGENLREFKGF